MPIHIERHRFTTWQISGAPAERGVYVLWQREEPIYVGATRGAATIRSLLLEHYARRVRPHDATHFSWEVSRDPARREAELLVEFRMANPQLPRRNQSSE